jgi:hypothetical protein
VGGRCPFHDLSVGETAAPDFSGECGGGKTPPQISRRKDQAGSPGTEEKTSRTRYIHTMAFTPGFAPEILCRFLIGLCNHTHWLRTRNGEATYPS